MDLGSDLRINGIIFLYSVYWVCLCSLNDLLCVVKNKQAEQGQASVDAQGVESCSKS